MGAFVGNGVGGTVGAGVGTGVGGADGAGVGGAVGYNKVKRCDTKRRDD